MKKLILVRAGSTAWEESSGSRYDGFASDDWRLQGTVPLPLTEQAKQALSSISSALVCEGAEMIYSSGNESSGPTAQYLARMSRLKSKEAPMIVELDCGLWQGLMIKEIKNRIERAYRQWLSDPTSICPPQGESVTSASERICRALLLLQNKNNDKTVVIVGAKIVAALIECILTDSGLNQIWHFYDQPVPFRIFECRNIKFFYAKK